ncbi:unnamed protein product, partial [Choristocarpus tenellus]
MRPSHARVGPFPSQPEVTTTPSTKTVVPRSPKVEMLPGNSPGKISLELPHTPSEVCGSLSVMSSLSAKSFKSLTPQSPYRPPPGRIPPGLLSTRSAPTPRLMTSGSRAKADFAT